MSYEEKIEFGMNDELSFELRKPRMYNVILHNDDFTTMDFVVDILMLIFHKDKGEATKVMLEVHNSGKGTAGLYTYDIAVTKKQQAEQISNEKGFPLKLTLNEAME